MEASSITLDDEVSLDLGKIMEEEDRRISIEYSKDSFQFIFLPLNTNGSSIKRVFDGIF